MDYYVTGTKGLKALEDFAHEGTIHLRDNQVQARKAVKPAEAGKKKRPTKAR